MTSHAQKRYTANSLDASPDPAQPLNGSSPKPDAYQLRLVYSEEKEIWYALLFSGRDNKVFEVGGPNLGKVLQAVRKTVLEHETTFQTPEVEPLVVLASPSDL